MEEDNKPDSGPYGDIDTNDTPSGPPTPPIYEKLKGLRSRKDLEVRSTKHLKETFTGYDGKEHPLRLRYYQIQGMMHLLAMGRFLLGDDVGLGKTLQSIAALCYLWERNPDLKVLIFTTKSSIEQWASEFRKFTKGTQALVCRGTPKQREKTRKAFINSSGPTVMVMGYGTAKQDFSEMQDWEKFVLITDECFDYHTPILLEDGTTDLIGRIVSKKIPARVLSWNQDTGMVEPKTVTNWFRKPLEDGRRSSTSLTRVSFRYSGNVRVTRSHLFYTPGEKTPLSRLRVGSTVFHCTDKYPSESQWQVLLGSLLGDGSITGPERNLQGMSFVHCENQRKLLEFKHQALFSLGVSDMRWGPGGGIEKKSGPKIHGRFNAAGNAAFSRFVDKAGIRREGKKRVTAEWLDKLGPLGLAVWYADDGSANTHTAKDGTVSTIVQISTHGFSREDHEVMVGWLRWKWGVKAEIKTARYTGKKRKTYSYIYLNRHETTKFFSLLPGSIPGVEYKFPPGMPVVDISKDLVPTTALVEDEITGMDSWKPHSNHKYVYDLEVESNHNYFANGTLVSNCTAYKNPKTQTHKVVKYLGSKASKMWALTATLIKNNLMEGWGIYSALVPGLFGSETAFMNEYCIIRMMQVPKSRRQIPMIVGYRPKDVAAFREKIDPYFLGRPKFEVASELPPLTIRSVKVDLTPYQEEKYAEALSGLLTIGTSKPGEEEEKEVTKLTAVNYCQQIVNHPQLIGCDGDSSKLDALLDLITEGEFEDEKVIVFSRFRKMIDIIGPALKKAGVASVRITGEEDPKARKASQDAFQDPNGKVRVVLITMAAAEAINLQAAKAIIFYDSPWSAGDFIQILGRMIRIGSIHDRVHAIHLEARKTIDERVNQVLMKKMGLVEAVLGKKLKGDDSSVIVQAENDLSDLFASLVNDAKSLQK